MAAYLLKRRLSLMLVTLFSLCLFLPSCSSSPSSSPKPSSDRTAPDSLVGYWRPAETKDWEGPKLLKVGKVSNGFTLDAPPAFLNGCRLVVKDGDLIFHFMENGKELEREVFSAGQGSDELVWKSYGPPFTEPIFTTRWKRATGSEAQLSEELRCWAANNTIQNQVTTLAKAFSLWAYEHGGQTPPGHGRFPSRKALSPGGAF